ncbi:MAG: hypothetical protein U5K54_24665 [Cytophagales bacterium]|nr:hypothetical protein [Cytophagales bacterium]
MSIFRITLRRKKMHEEGLLFKIFAANEKSQEPLSEEELISICIFLFTAGEETTSGLIGIGVYHLTMNSKSPLRTQQEWDLAIDELLRFNPPVQLLGRIALKTQMCTEKPYRREARLLFVWEQPIVTLKFLISPMN